MNKKWLQPKEAVEREQHFEFFNEELLPDSEKLPLLNFLMLEFDLRQPIVLKGKGCSLGAQFLVEQYVHQQAKIDLLYIDTEALCDIPRYLLIQLFDRLSRRGMVCVESYNTAEKNSLNTLLIDAFELVLPSANFSIFARRDSERPLRSLRYQVDLFRRKLYFQRKLRMKADGGIKTPVVAIIVLAYNHEGYIAECLRSVLGQRGHFLTRVIIIDDASSDETAQIIHSIIAKTKEPHIEIDFQANTQNIGVVANLATAIRQAAGCDYLTFCEGDDFWSSDQRLQEHINFLENWPDAVISFNTIELCTAEGLLRCIFPDHANLAENSIVGIQLAENNLVGNFTACFYRGELIDVIPQELFRLYTVDWFFNLYCSQFGAIAHLKKPLSVYRQHKESEWSSRNELDKITLLLDYIAEYNAFLDYTYNKGLQNYSRKLYTLLDKQLAGTAKVLDLIVFDDVFPSGRSGFRHAEFTSYLYTFPSSLVLTSGSSLPVLEDTPITNVIRDYQRQHPNIGNRVKLYTDAFPLRLGKMVYMNFLSNAFAMLPDIEAANVPFVFTLYPGAGFVLNNPECDRRLKRVFDSSCFKQVIVTQQVTYDYIVRRNLCPPEKIQMIFGVVMPEFHFDHTKLDKRRWGFGKPRLDICFMAHKYTPYGEDKGYDVFINIASILSQRYDDIYFHVAGPFDRRVIDVSSFRDRITFHSSLNPEDFDSFFLDMDIIVSPNISGKIHPGSFDGFPTASCTEAGLRGTAIFAVDEFNSANGRFTDGEDIVLIKYDLADIVKQVERYYADPEALKAIGEHGSRRIRELYSYEAQIMPRIKILRETMNEAAVTQTSQVNTQSNQQTDMYPNEQLTATMVERIPLVSVVVPSYNHSSYISKALESVLSQDFSNFELLISDDASSDDSWDIISRFSDPRIRAFRQKKNLGPVGNLVFLIKKARGKYVALLNSDDRWYREKLGKQVDVMESRPELGACFTWADMVDEQDQEVSGPEAIWSSIFRQPNRTQGEWLRQFFFNGNCLCHPSILARKEIYENLGFYNPGFKQLPDFEMWIRLVKHYPIHIVQASLVAHLRYGKNTSAISDENSARNLTELVEIFGSFFEGVPDEIFLEGFANDLRIKDLPITPTRLRCEKLFLLLDSAFAQAAGRAAALSAFIRYFSDADIARVLRDEYQFSVFDFYQLTGTSGFGHHLMLTMKMPESKNNKTVGYLPVMASRLSRYFNRLVARFIQSVCPR